MKKIICDMCGKEGSIDDFIQKGKHTLIFTYKGVNFKLSPDNPSIQVCFDCMLQSIMNGIRVDKINIDPINDVEKIKNMLFGCGLSMSGSLKIFYSNIGKIVLDQYIKASKISAFSSLKLSKTLGEISPSAIEAFLLHHGLIAPHKDETLLEAVKKYKDSGFTTKDIASFLDITYSSAYNLINRLKKKEEGEA